MLENRTARVSEKKQQLTIDPFKKHAKENLQLSYRSLNESTTSPKRPDLYHIAGRLLPSLTYSRKEAHLLR